jgi:hypothetical protein
MAGALREYGQGDVVFRKGEISESMYAVISGKLEVLDPAETPEADAAPPENTFPRHIATLAPGDVVGEMGMIRSCERSATVVASTPAELIQINERMLKRLQWLFPPTAHKFFFNLMGQLCDRVQRMTECYLGSGIIDPVTGLHTRSHVLSVLDREVRCAVRYQTPLSLFLLNLASDSLQSEPLHCEGQPPLLLEIGKRLRGVLSPADPVCRYTACRFAGVLHLDTQATTEICRRLSAAITERPVQLDDREHHLKVHIGITTLDPHRDLHRQGGFDPLAVASQALEEAIRTDATEPVLRTEIL